MNANFDIRWKEQIVPAILMTVVLTVLLGLVYPLAVTGLAHLLFPRQAAGSLIYRGTKVIGSRLIGQPFASPGHFHSRPSAAAEYQVARVAKARSLSEEEVRRLVAEHTEGRQLGILGEPRVNVLELNLALDGRK